MKRRAMWRGRGNGDDGYRFNCLTIVSMSDIVMMLLTMTMMVSMMMVP